MRNKLGFVVLSVALGGLLSACSSMPDAVNPISWYRDVTGASKNDNLGKGQNEQNLDEGDNEPYPNLGSVPNPPDTQLSGVDRDKLVNSLVADRRNAQYSADNLRAGEVASTVPPPPPPAATSANASSATVGGASTPAPSSASPSPVASAPATPAAPSSPSATASASPPPPAAPGPTAATKSASSSAASGGNGSTKTASNNALSSSSSSKKPPPRGSEAPPPESTLQSPTIPNVPQGEAATPSPPLPNIPRPGETASAAPTPKSAAPAREPAKPARPALVRPTQQATAPANTPPATPLHRPAISYRVADVSFARGSAAITDGTHNTIAEIVKLHNEDGGMIRVIGHGEATGKDAAMVGFTLALDRAEAVAVALADAGVDAKDIAVEAAPVQAKGGADAPRAEVYLEH